MRILRALVILLVLGGALPDTSRAQFENYTWYFGDGQGLDFSTNPPTFLNDGALFCFEGSASISDPNTGKLLFYTDGIMVVNRAHNVMPNGADLYSDMSSTQPAVIIPMPGSTTKYYIFTADQSGYRGAPRGINYSIVDMTKDNGFGDVVEKNVQLLGPASEKITAVRICNGDAYWIIAHAFYGSKFYAWHVDENGIDFPVISEIGTYHGPNGGDGVGWMSASPDGTMLALTFFERSTNNIELFKFDPTTGIVSSPILLPNGIQPYGATFSPQNKKLYVTSIGRIEQFDVQKWDVVSIYNSWQPLYSTTKDNGAIKIGPDGKLYIQHAEYIGTIDYPELPGAQCQYNERAIYASPGSKYGLPNNVDANAALCPPPQAAIKSFDSTICQSECINFFDSSRFGATSWRWEFQGGTPNTSVLKDPTNICYPTPGRYYVKLTATNASGSSFVNATVVVGECLPPVVALHDTVICKGSCVSFVDTSRPSSTRTWRFTGGSLDSADGKTPTAVCYDYPGEYEVRLIAVNEYGVDTAIAKVTVEDCPWPVARSEYDTAICAGNTVDFTDRSANDPSSWEWQFEGGSPATSTTKDPQAIRYDLPGYYKITQIVQNANGSDTAFTQIHVKKCDPPTTHLFDRDICEGDCIELFDSSTGSPTSWEWLLTGPIERTYNVKDPGVLCFEQAGTYQLRQIARNDYGADTAMSAILVNSAAGSATRSIYVESIPMCSELDTFITLYTGCRALSYEDITSSSASVMIANIRGVIQPYDSVRLSVRLSPLAVGTVSEQITLKLGATQYDVSVFFQGVRDKEQFTFGAFDGDFAALLCETDRHTLEVTNDACAAQTIRSVAIEPPNAGFAVLEFFPRTWERNESHKITIEYSSALSATSDAELVIITADGTERRYKLSGTRLQPRSSTLRVAATGPTALAPNDVTSAKISFDEDINAELAPEMIELLFNYNTDLITTSKVTPQDGWTMINLNEGLDELRLRFVRNKQAIAANATIVDIEFNSFLTARSYTALRLQSIRCEPDDPDFERCVLTLATKDSSTVTMLPVCGSIEIQSALRSEPSFSIAINPHPIIAGDALRFSLRTEAPDLGGADISVELIDLMGRSEILLQGVLRSPMEEFDLPLGRVASGIYVLKVHVGSEARSRTLVIQ